MSRAAATLMFIVCIITAIFGMHWYMWARLVRDPGVPAPWRQLAVVALIVMSLGVPLAGAFWRTLDLPWGRWVAAVAFSWLGVLLLLLVSLAGTELVRIASLFTTPHDPDRRLFLARLLAGGALLSTFGLGAAAAVIVARGPKVRRVAVALRRLPAAMDGSTIVQISDLHVGPTIDRAYVEAVVAGANALEPDVIAITGDLVDGTVTQLRDAVAPLGGLRAKHGVFFVTGNHEYYSGADAWVAELTRLGIKVLRNERVTIGAGEASYELAGVDDYTAHRFGRGHGADMKKALAGVDPSREVVLLAHQPKHIVEAEAAGVGLQLAGHTHGGQIWPFGLIVRMVQPYVRGLNRHGRAQIYVSCGTGYWGPPMRLGAPPELSHIVLRSAPV